MIIVMQANANEIAIQNVVNTIRQQGLREHVSRGTEHTIIGAVGDERVFDVAKIEALPQVERAIRIMHDWRMISREASAQDTQITIRGTVFGGACTQYMHYFTDNQPQSTDCNSILLDPFFHHSNPYTTVEKLSKKETVKQLQHQTHTLHNQNKIIAIRIRDSAHIQIALNAQADILYLGGELIKNHQVLHEVGSLNTPAIICKDYHHTIRDWLLAAENIVLHGNQHVFLGEAGSLSLHGTSKRLDVEAITQAKQLSHLPIAANISQLSHRYMPTEILVALALAAGAHIIIK